MLILTDGQFQGTLCVLAKTDGFLYHIHTSVHTSSINLSSTWMCSLFLPLNSLQESVWDLNLFLLFSGTREKHLKHLNKQLVFLITNTCVAWTEALCREDKENGRDASGPKFSLEPSTHLSNWESSPVFVCKNDHLASWRDLPAAVQCQGLVLSPALKGRCTFCCCSAGVQTDTANVRRWTQVHNLKRQRGLSGMMKYLTTESVKVN